MSSLRTATSLLIGTIVGAGFLGIPYMAARAGFVPTMIHIIVIGAAVCLLTLYLAEITLRTKKNHQLVGYAERYLGTPGKLFMLTATIVGISTALAAYLIGQGHSLSFLMSGSTEYALPALLAAWLLFACITHRRQSVGKTEAIGVLLMIALIVLIVVRNAPFIRFENLASVSLQDVMLPFGVVLFAFLGFSAIPEMKIVLKNNAAGMKSIIIKSYLLVGALYILFTLAVLGTHGMQTPEIATLALGRVFVFLSIITLSTAYLALTLALIDTLAYDCHSSRTKAWLAANLIPLALVLLLASLEKASFTLIISISGILSGTLTALLILAMLPRARRSGIPAPFKTPYASWLAWLLALLFLGGALAELIALFR